MNNATSENALKARALFEDYSRRSNAALHDPEQADMNILANYFASHFIGASPNGVLGAENDESFGTVLRQGFENYRAMGGRRFEIVRLQTQTLDDFNVSVWADWEFDYQRRSDGAEGTIAFRNIYLVNFAGGDPKIFAWITADETQVMKDHGLM